MIPSTIAVVSRVSHCTTALMSERFALSIGVNTQLLLMIRLKSMVDFKVIIQVLQFIVFIDCNGEDWAGRLKIALSLFRSNLFSSLLRKALFPKEDGFIIRCLTKEYKDDFYV